MTYPRPISRRCPTCPDAKPDRCCCCGQVDCDAFPLDIAPNPYAWDVHGDPSDHLMCESCRAEAAMDI